MPKKLKNPVDTGRKTGVPSADTGQTVQRTVYTVDQVVEIEINTEVLKATKAKLQDEIAEIDTLLGQIND